MCFTSTVSSTGKISTIVHWMYNKLVYQPQIEFLCAHQSSQTISHPPEKWERVWLDRTWTHRVTCQVLRRLSILLQLWRQRTANRWTIKGCSLVPRPPLFYLWLPPKIHSKSSGKRLRQSWVETNIILLRISVTLQRSKRCTTELLLRVGLICTV